MHDQRPGVIYKLLPRAEWEAAVAAGEYRGSEVDLRDGFIHFSTGAQVAATAAKHFRGIPDLVVAAFETAALETSLSWEPSRGGDLFPHLYAVLDPGCAVWVAPAPLDDAGVPVLPERIASC